MLIEILLFVCVALLLLAVTLLALLLQRKTETDLSPVQNAMAQTSERTERIVRDEIGRNRDESSTVLRQTREEVAGSVRGIGESLVGSVGELGRLQKSQLEVLAERLGQMAQMLGEQLNAGRLESTSAAGKLREDSTTSMKGYADQMSRTLGEIGSLQRSQLGNVVTQLEKLTASSSQQGEALRLTVQTQLKQMQEENAAKLEQMRATVDEKLQGTLEKRLGESFKLVSERLEAVYKGLGEMQTLATGVGDLKKVLSNVKTRGIWGEVQLGNLLGQVLTPDQYACNVQVNPQRNERVEFAVRLPGRSDDGQPVWLPIDAKFPQEDYQRLVDASERGDVEAVALSSTALQDRILQEAITIRQKYICSPFTTDFAILFLPTEGLYAEVLRRPGLCEGIMRDQRVVVAGPTTLAAVLNSLHMGFRTLAIEKRSSEVWRVLGAVKTEFSKFGDVLDKVKKKLEEAGNTIDSAQVRSRAVQRSLKAVESSPAEAAGEQGPLILEALPVTAIVPPEE